MITQVAASESALHALRNVSTKAILHLRSIAQNGGLVGKQYDRCFYGTLATGSGHYIGHGPTQFQNLDNFCRNVIGIRLCYGKLGQPIEVFCAHVHESEKAENNLTLSLIIKWCNEELACRSYVALCVELPDQTDIEVCNSLEEQFVGV